MQVLLRALRDFNLGKLTVDDKQIFLGLLDDLFPRIAESVPRAVDTAFEQEVVLSLCCLVSSGTSAIMHQPASLLLAWAGLKSCYGAWT